ncbi:hypothetical protein HNR44_003537 [Geomicrobium halophilum]|uniref:Uncharacterized protein n=1 Tax=Geomicrobium halophilum TaxID=549000 RepID=A0A841PUX0_9BACL|nr:hypothetical protein [Geomicrobium halophilum]MBB6451524.1 hypothetical protein [Geomicrobium halophilum]
MANQPLISQTSASLIEHARRQGLSELELQQAFAEEDVSFLNAKSAEYFNYDELFTYAKRHNEELVRAIEQGYQMKFNTLDGLKTWLTEKFGFQEGVPTEKKQAKLKG